MPTFHYRYTPPGISLDNEKTRPNYAQAFRGWVSRLYHVATSSGAPFSLYTGDVLAMRASGGLQYHSNPGSQVEATPWFVHTRYAQQAREADKTAGRPHRNYGELAVQLLIYWPNFLYQAQHLSPQPILRGLANELLIFLYPLIAQYDRVLADMILRFRQNYFENKNVGANYKPLYFGAESAEEDDRFALHLKTLLGNKDFQKYLNRTMSASLELAVAKIATKEIARCPITGENGVARHRRDNKDCKACEALRWTLGITLLNPEDLVFAKFQARYTFVLHKPEYFKEYTKEWYRELQYILSARDASEGVAHITPLNGRGELYLVNFDALIGLTRQYRVKPWEPKFKGDVDVQAGIRHASILSEYDARFPGNPWVAGHFAKTDFIEWAGQDVVATNRPKSLKELVQEAGWSWRETVEQPYELFYMGSLLRRHSLYDKSLTTLANVDERKRKAAARNTAAYHPKVIDLTFQYSSGNTVTVSALQRVLDKQLTTYYTLPYALNDAELTADARRYVSLQVDGLVFWTLSAITHFAEMRDDRKRLVYPLAEEFASWVRSLDAGMTRDKFKRVRFEGAYQERVVEYMQEKRAHLGHFTRYEDDQIVLFLNARGKGRLTYSEWTSLLNLLPGRTKVSVKDRLETLGKQFAAQHGWTAYRESPLCLKSDVRRKERWVKEGVLSRAEA